jgi:hypothetical protein
MLLLRCRKRMHALPKFHRTCSNASNNAIVIRRQWPEAVLKNRDHLVHAKVNI